MWCVVSCGSTSFPWLVFFFGALLWGSMIHNHTGRRMWQGSAYDHNTRQSKTLVCPRDSFCISYYCRFPVMSKQRLTKGLSYILSLCVSLRWRSLSNLIVEKRRAFGSTLANRISQKCPFCPARNISYLWKDQYVGHRGNVMPLYWSWNWSPFVRSPWQRYMS